MFYSTVLDVNLDRLHLYLTIESLTMYNLNGLCFT